MQNDAKAEILALPRAQEAAVARGDANAVVAPLAEALVTYDLPTSLEYRGAGTAYAKGLEQ